MQDVSGYSISQRITLCGMHGTIFPTVSCGLSRQRNDFWTLKQITHVKITSQNASKNFSVPGVQRYNSEAMPC